jgi:nucleoside-diphosphate-sugar epimerase
MRLLITGGAGFIGSNFVRYLGDKHPVYDIVVEDVPATVAGTTGCDPDPGIAARIPSSSAKGASALTVRSA